MTTLALPAKLVAAAVAAAVLAPAPANRPELASLGVQPTAAVEAAAFPDARSRYALANALGFGGELPDFTNAGAAVPEGLYAQMDDGDVAMAAATLHVALEEASSGTGRAWRSGLSGNGGSITPLGRAYRDGDGRTCRNYREHLAVAGRMQSFTHRACRTDSGVWVLMD